MTSHQPGPQPPACPPPPPLTQTTWETLPRAARQQALQLLALLLRASLEGRRGVPTAEEASHER